MADEKIHNDGRSADDVGLVAKQTSHRKDPDIEQRHRFARGPSQTPLPSDRYGEAQAREMEEDRIAVDAHRKIKKILEEEEAKEQARRPQQQQRRPQQQARPKQGGLSMADLMEGLEGQLDAATEDVARDLLIENFQSEAPSEAALYTNSYARPEPKMPESHDWTVKKFQAKLRSGKKIPVWKVFNEKTKMSMETPFRIMEAAERIAAILNQTGDVNDQRIKGIMEAYNRHRALMKHIRQLREAINAGRKSLRPKLTEATDELEQINYKLGI